jgi:hypothetical protein
MRIRNLSPKSIYSRLWHLLAEDMKLSRELPLVSEDPEMYPTHKRLLVTIRPYRTHPPSEVVVSGYYSFGRIVLLPCKQCSSGFLTHLYLHELFHAWVDQFHQSFYDSVDHCQMAESFADAAFSLLGGSIRPKRVCGSFDLSQRHALSCIWHFSRLTKSLTSCTDRQFLPWSPG